MMISSNAFLRLGITVLMSLYIGPTYGIDYYQPEQVHIAFGYSPDEMMITWTTLNDTEESLVKFGEQNPDNETKGHMRPFIDGGHEKRTIYMHNCMLKSLKPDTKYKYIVGGSRGWSEEFSFKTLPKEGVLRIGVYGDLGNTSAKALPYIKEEAERDHFDFILHLGDFAHDLQDDNARVGDEFMRQIQPIAAKLPYMTCPGNHEHSYNFSNYKNRFRMPTSDPDTMFYSFNQGPVHFVAVDTEAYYYFCFYGGLVLVDTQYNWLKEDLANAAKPENRQKRPWIIMFGHRPMYCSSKGDGCWNKYLQNRVGAKGRGALEPLLNEYGVDLVLWAHQHSYERLWPVYNLTVYNGTKGPYINPRAPVHMITGSAGSKANTDGFLNVSDPWSAFHSTHHGYSRMTIYNNTHIHFDQVDVDKGGKVIDSMWLVQEHHGPFNL